MPFNMNTFSKMWGISKPEEAKAMQPKVVLVDDKNAVSKISHYEKHGELA